MHSVASQHKGQNAVSERLMTYTFGSIPNCDLHGKRAVRIVALEFC